MGLCLCVSATFLQIWSDFSHETDDVCVKVKLCDPCLVNGCVSSLCLWSLRILHPFCLWSRLPSENINDMDDGFVEFLVFGIVLKSVNLLLIKYCTVFFYVIN